MCMVVTYVVHASTANEACIAKLEKQYVVTYFANTRGANFLDFGHAGGWRCGSMSSQYLSDGKASWLFPLRGLFGTIGTSAGSKSERISLSRYCRCWSNGESRERCSRNFGTCGTARFDLVHLSLPPSKVIRLLLWYACSRLKILLDGGIVIKFHFWIWGLKI